MSHFCARESCKIWLVLTAMVYKFIIYFYCFTRATPRYDFYFLFSFKKLSKNNELDSTLRNIYVISEAEWNPFFSLIYTYVKQEVVRHIFSWQKSVHLYSPRLWVIIWLLWSNRNFFYKGQTQLYRRKCFSGESALDWDEHPQELWIITKLIPVHSECKAHFFDPVFSNINIEKHL